jgi:hypothetical protein
MRTIPGAFESSRRGGDEGAWREVLVRKRARMIVFNAAFYFPGVLVLGLAGLPAAIRDRWILFAVASFGAVLSVVFWGNTTYAPHYSAPVAPLAFAVLVASVRCLGAWTWRARNVGRWLVRALGIAFLAVSVQGLFVSVPDVAGSDWGTVRRDLIARLRSLPGRHLVVVRYGKGQHSHDQWVQNEADIDHAPVVWAHSRKAEHEGRLLDYFGDRTVWELDATVSPPRLSRVRDRSR